MVHWLAVLDAYHEELREVLQDRSVYQVESLLVVVL